MAGVLGIINIIRKIIYALWSCTSSQFRFFKCCKQKHKHKRMDVSIHNRKGLRRWPYHFQTLVFAKLRFPTIHCLSRRRLAHASILGPFGVHLLRFTLATHPGSALFGVASLSERSDPQVTRLNKIKCGSTAAGVRVCTWYERFNKQSIEPGLACKTHFTLHSNISHFTPTFRSTPLAPCHLPNCISPWGKERHY